VSISEDQHRLLYRIAQAYYSDGLTQDQIATHFGLSRPKVSRLLHKARAEQIITITLLPPPSGLSDVERDLEKRYGLQEAVVVPVSDPDDLGLVARELGPAGAECFVRSISGRETVGLTWGTSVLAVVDSLPTRFWPDVTIVQMLGGVGPLDAQEHATELTRRAAQRLSAKLRLLPAPGIVSSRETAQALRSDHQIAETLALAARADLALAGVGVPSPFSVVLRSGTILREQDLKLLEEAGAVGDIGLRYMDAYGRPVDLEINERMIGVTLEQLKNIPRVIGVAGGTAKHPVIRAALRGEILDVLVTDHATAQWLLAEAQ
jgi:DNA-binding transcriptional regulator LsrR (DeoR family)